MIIEKIIKKLLLVCLLFLAVNACSDKNDTEGEIEIEIEIPDDESGYDAVLFMSEEDVDLIKANIASNSIARSVHERIIQTCQELLSRNPMSAITSLKDARDFRGRIFNLAYGFRITKDYRYFLKAQSELQSIAALNDWNNAQFLSVSEVTMAMALGYDWLHNELTTETKEAIEQAIYNNGLEASITGDSWWLEHYGNWNQVCNTAMFLGAVVLRDVYPDKANFIIDRTFESIQIPMNNYAPDGVFHEGFSYWDYGTGFNIYFLAALENIDNLTQVAPDSNTFLKTGDFLNHLVTPSLKSFNFADAENEDPFVPFIYWIADKLNQPSVAWSEQQKLIKNLNNLGGGRDLPMFMVFAKNLNLDAIETPSKKLWMGQGEASVAMMRNNWEEDAMYVGYKAGRPNMSHSHMDIGSFIVEWNGIRWAEDLGRNDYDALDLAGIKRTDMKQDGDRWKVYRNSNKSHNVLIVDDALQIFNGHAGIDQFSEQEDFMFAMSDMLEMYGSKLKSAKRGVGLKELSYVVVRDEIETNNKTTMIRWQMMTPTSVQLGQNEATLSSGNHKMKLKIQSSFPVEMKTWSADPPMPYDDENPGRTLVGFECELPANTKANFEVIITPENVQGSFTNKILNNWQ